jgi:hypothetical protein
VDEETAMVAPMTVAESTAGGGLTIGYAELDRWLSIAAASWST